MKIKVQILTPEWNREVEADAVFLPGAFAPFEVLPGHAPMISTLEAGDIILRVDGKEEKVAVKRGVVRVGRSEMQICAEV